MVRFADKLRFNIDFSYQTMNSKRIAFAALAIAALTLTSFAVGISVGEARSVDTRVYELRTYTTNPGRLPALHKRFADHTMRLFEKHGMQNVMYWTPMDSARKDNTLIYVISHASREAADKSWREFAADSAWIMVSRASEVDGRILAKAPERVYMTATPWSPPR